MTNSSELHGKVALVTGASGGIGSAIANGLAAEGATLALAYGSNAEPAERLATHITNSGGRAIAIGADLGSRLAPERLVDAIEATLGAIDMLIANAGTGRIASYEAVDAVVFDETLAVNLRAPYLLARRVLPGMIDRGFGRILFMSSVAAFTGGSWVPTTRHRRRACTA